VFGHVAVPFGLMRFVLESSVELSFE